MSRSSAREVADVFATYRVFCNSWLMSSVDRWRPPRCHRHRRMHVLDRRSNYRLSRPAPRNAEVRPLSRSTELVEPRPAGPCSRPHWSLDSASGRSAAVVALVRPSVRPSVSLSIQSRRGDRRRGADRARPSGAGRPAGRATGWSRVIWRRQRRCV